MEQVRGPESEIRRLAQEKERFKSLLHAVIHLGAALLAEENFDRLLETIVVEAMSFCNADAGSLYLRNSDDTLSFVIMRCHSLHLAKGGTTGEKIPFSPLPMYDPRPVARTVTTSSVKRRSAAWRSTSPMPTMPPASTFPAPAPSTG
jgi:hypothetical protein